MSREKLSSTGGTDKTLFVGDLTKENDVNKIVETTISVLGRIDVLINNAGILEQGSIENTSMEQFDRIMNVNMR